MGSVFVAMIAKSVLLWGLATTRPGEGIGRLDHLHATSRTLSGRTWWDYWSGFGRLSLDLG